MAKYTLAETTEWVAANLRQAEDVSKVELLSDQVLRVSRTKYDPYTAGLVSEKCVDVDAVRPLVKPTLGVEIIANVPKESYWTGKALQLAKKPCLLSGGCASTIGF
jgi:murein endopeptidase